MNPCLISFPRVFSAVLIWTAAMLHGCGGKNQDSDQLVPLDSPMSVALPKALRAANLPAGYTLRIDAIVDSEKTYVVDKDEEVSNGIFKGRLQLTLPPGDHTVSLAYYLVDANGNATVIAMSSAPISVKVNGSETSVVDFSTQDLNYDDSDGDNHSNLSELLRDGDVNNSAVFPFPSVPENLRVESSDNGNVVIAWDQVQGASSYRVYMAGESGVDKTNSNSLKGWMEHTVAASTASVGRFEHGVGSLSNGVTRSFIVSAINERGEGPPSIEVAGTPQLAPPTNVSLVGSASSLSVSWDSVPSAKGYTVFLRKDSEPTLDVADQRRDVDGGATKQTLFSGLIPGQTYFVAVQAREGTATSPLSARVPGATVNATVPSLTVGTAREKLNTLVFSWDKVDAHHFKLLKNANGQSGFTQIGPDTTETTMEERVSVHLFDWINAQYILQACDENDVCTDSKPTQVQSAMVDAIARFKASNTEAGDEFGSAVALSADGNTLAVAATGDDSDVTEINGSQGNSINGGNYGAVFVFTRSGSGWAQQAYLKVKDSNGGDRWGDALAISSDGNTLAVGSYHDDSNLRGINNPGSDNNLSQFSGAIVVFERVGNNWSQQAYIKASNTEERNENSATGDRFGSTIALSSSGDTLAVGAPKERSAARGINGDEADNSTPDAGAVYVFTRSGGAWSQQAYIKASNTDGRDFFGGKVALAASGDILAVGALGESSDATGADEDNSATESGAVYIFERSNSSWSQQAKLKASNAEANDAFGRSVSLSGDGSTLAVGASGEQSNAVGINGDETNNSLKFAGAVYVYVRGDNGWQKMAYIKPSNPDSYDYFGGSSFSALMLSNDGKIMAVGSPGEDSKSRGINGTQRNDFTSSEGSAGAVYVFTVENENWVQSAYVKASDTQAEDVFGVSMAISGDGKTMAVGAFYEDGDAVGVNGVDTLPMGARNSGAVYLY